VVKNNLPIVYLSITTDTAYCWEHNIRVGWRGGCDRRTIASGGGWLAYGVDDG
jgi:hypothetical protein